MRIELGCGSSKRDPSAIGVDRLPYPGVDIVGEIPSVLSTLPDSVVTAISSEHFLENVDDLGLLLTEAARLLQPGGLFRAVVPHFSNPLFFSDPTHRAFFGLYSMSYFAIDDLLRRPVPKYLPPDQSPCFRLTGVRLVFARSRRRPLQYLVGRLFEQFVNLSARTLEYYEEYLSSVVYCSEVHYELTRL